MFQQPTRCHFACSAFNECPAAKAVQEAVGRAAALNYWAAINTRQAWPAGWASASSSTLLTSPMPCPAEPNWESTGRSALGCGGESGLSYIKARAAKKAKLLCSFPGPFSLRAQGYQTDSNQTKCCLMLAQQWHTLYSPSNSTCIAFKLFIFQIIWLAICIENTQTHTYVSLVMY